MMEAMARVRRLNFLLSSKHLLNLNHVSRKYSKLVISNVLGNIS